MKTVYWGCCYPRISSSGWVTTDYADVYMKIGGHISYIQKWGGSRFHESRYRFLLDERARRLYLNCRSKDSTIAAKLSNRYRRASISRSKFAVLRLGMTYDMYVPLSTCSESNRQAFIYFIIIFLDSAEPLWCWYQLQVPCLWLFYLLQSLAPSSRSIWYAM
jgi:hypothetical protein